ncbi:hypothetical protein EBN03_27010 [Nocardia stercoris]|uniref:Uncharacterized protein n=2 Tax=Nocardia stercoris TaxID=2483361 RepID=A0A3M2KXC5_9NOCA|nr:hypothetical protein EBN03_27010 [Nocardia stercoris]
MWRRLRGSGAVARLDPADPDLVVVVASFDDAEACSAALARGADPARSPVSFAPDAPALFRHHLRLPADQVSAVLALTAQAGYTRGADRADAEATDASGTPLILQRVQILDAVHCSQERSRMASVAHRHGGTALGWDALQPAPRAR